MVHAGRLTCEGSRALVRVGFGAVDDGPVRFPALPAQISAFQAAAVDGNQCTLDDGREVRVKLGFEQGQSSGFCGGGTNSFLSLWVGGKKVLSRQPALRECFSKGHVDLIVLDGAKLTLCTSTESMALLMQNQPITAGCVDASDRLRDALPDAVEYPTDPAQQPAVGSVQITLNARPGLCEAFLSIQKPDKPVDSEAIWAAQVRDAPFAPMLMRLDAVTDAALARGAERKPLPDFSLPDTATAQVFKPLPALADRKEWAPYLTWSEADFDSDGLRDLILRFSGRSGADDSDVFYVVHGAAIERMRAMIEAEPEPAAEKWSRYLRRALEQAPGVDSYADGFGHPVDPHQTRATYQMSFTSDGETFVFAAPIHRRNRPTAIIYKPLPGGKSQQVCVFQRVEENW